MKTDVTSSCQHCKQHLILNIDYLYNKNYLIQFKDATKKGKLK